MTETNEYKKWFFIGYRSYKNSYINFGLADITKESESLSYIVKLGITTNTDGYYDLFSDFDTSYNNFTFGFTGSLNSLESTGLVIGYSF